MLCVQAQEGPVPEDPVSEDPVPAAAEAPHNIYTTLGSDNDDRVLRSITYEVRLI